MSPASGGIIHRDLKPANIIINEFNLKPHVMDFRAREGTRVDHVPLTSTEAPRWGPRLLHAAGAGACVSPQPRPADRRVRHRRGPVPRADAAAAVHGKHGAPRAAQGARGGSVSPRSIDPTIERALELIIFRRCRRTAWTGIRRRQPQPATADGS